MHIWSTGKSECPFLYSNDASVGKGHFAAKTEDIALIRFGLNVLYMAQPFLPCAQMCRELPWYGDCDEQLVACITAVQKINDMTADGYVSPLKTVAKMTMMGLLAHNMRKNLFDHWPYLWKAPQMKSPILRQKMQLAVEGVNAWPMPLK